MDFILREIVLVTVIFVLVILGILFAMWCISLRSNGTTFNGLLISGNPARPGVCQSIDTEDTNDCVVKSSCGNGWSGSSEGSGSSGDGCSEGGGCSNRSFFSSSRGAVYAFIIGIAIVVIIILFLMYRSPFSSSENSDGEETTTTIIYEEPPPPVVAPPTPKTTAVVTTTTTTPTVFYPSVPKIQPPSNRNQAFIPKTIPVVRQQQSQPQTATTNTVIDCASSGSCNDPRKNSYYGGGIPDYIKTVGG